MSIGIGSSWNDPIDRIEYIHPSTVKSLFKFYKKLSEKEQIKFNQLLQEDYTKQSRKAFSELKDEYLKSKKK